MYSAFKKTVLLFNNISIVELTKCLYEKKQPIDKTPQNSVESPKLQK